MSVIINPAPDDRRMNIWNIGDLYFGTPPTKEVWRPNVNDAVIDWDIGIFRVVSVNDQSIPTLELVTRFSQDSRFNLDSTSLITALSHYQPSAANKIFIDKSTAKATVNVDGRYVCYGSGPVRAVFFRGTDTSTDGEIVSEVYNGSGVLVSSEVPLEALNEFGTQHRPVQFKTSKNIDPGEVITGVFYTASGSVYSTQPFLAFESAAFRPIDVSQRYIDRISIRSDLVSDTEADLLLNSIDTPIENALMRGVLHYNDGSEQEIGIDGVKLVLMGLANFDTSVATRPTRVVLTYYPGVNEPFINGSMNNAASISQPYRLANTVRDASFAVKLFIIPEWNTATSQYGFRYYVLNLAGDLFVDVTADVSGVRESDGLALSGTDFTTRQDGVFSIDMETVSPVQFADYIHVQKIDITLDEPGAVSGQTFLIDYVGDSTNIYGLDVRAKTNGTGTLLNISNGLGIQSEWLNKLYRAIEPMYDASVLTEARSPTHFSVLYSGVETDKISLADYGTDVALPVGMTNWADKGTVTVRWILETPGGDLTLGVTPLFIESTL